jgi:hypothetical protein
MSTAVSATNAAKNLGGFRRLWRALRHLFHEVVGAVFAVLALGWLNTAIRTWSRDAARWLVAIPVGVALLLVFFAVTSFRKARRL